MFDGVVSEISSRVQIDRQTMPPNSTDHDTLHPVHCVEINCKCDDSGLINRHTVVILVPVM